MKKNRYDARSKGFGVPIIAFVNGMRGISREKKLEFLRNPHKFKKSPYRKFLENLGQVFGFSKSFVEKIGDQLVSYGEPDGCISVRSDVPWMREREKYPGYRMYDNLAKWDEELRGFLENTVSDVGLKNNREFEEWARWYDDVRVKEGVWMDPYGSPIVANYGIGKNLQYLQYPELVALVAICLIEFLKWEENRKRVSKCEHCGIFFLSKTEKGSKFCSDKCHVDFHNRRRIASGEAREYKRRRRAEGLDQ